MGLDIGRNAGIAQLVEQEPSKLQVTGSSPASRSKVGPYAVFFMFLVLAIVAQG